MSDPSPKQVWAAGDAYEPYIGRWSRLVARDFLDWLAIPGQRDWVDVGCGTGALCATILQRADPRSVTGIDPSAGFLDFARRNIVDSRARFTPGDAQALPVGDAAADAVVSGLVLNFVPDPARALREMWRALRPGGVAGVYVWDYAGEMQLLRHFWDAAMAIDPKARALDQASHYPLCHPDRLRVLFGGTGFADVEIRVIDVPTVFADFDDYWTPFLGGLGHAPAYCMSLSPTQREALRKILQARLPSGANGRLALIARAFACRGQRPAENPG